MWLVVLALGGFAEASAAHIGSALQQVSTVGASKPRAAALKYKLAWNGGPLVVVPPQYTSQTYPGCGHVSADNRRTQERFACVECGFVDHTDLVGAINILRAGHAR